MCAQLPPAPGTTPPLISQVFSNNDTGCRQAEGPLYPDEKSDKVEYDDDDEKKKKKKETSLYGFIKLIFLQTFLEVIIEFLLKLIYECGHDYPCQQRVPQGDDSITERLFTF